MFLSPHPRQLTRWSLAVAGIGIGTWLLAAPVPTNKEISGAASFPDWWFERDVIGYKGPGSTYPVDYAAAEDYAVVNTGQLKFMARCAYDELSARLPASVQSSPEWTALTALIASWYVGGDLNAAPASGDPWLAINQGQLKYVTKHFYDVLDVAGYDPGLGYPPSAWGASGWTDPYPWTEVTSDDESYAQVNAGQLKYALSFDLTNPDWLAAQSGNPGGSTPPGSSPASANDPDRDGLSSEQEQALGTNPNLADSDGDGAVDGEDGWPHDGNLSPERVSENYAPINLSGPLTHRSNASLQVDDLSRILQSWSSSSSAGTSSAARLLDLRNSSLTDPQALQQTNATTQSYDEPATIFITNTRTEPLLHRNGAISVGRVTFLQQTSPEGVFQTQYFNDVRPVIIAPSGAVQLLNLPFPDAEGDYSRLYMESDLVRSEYGAPAFLTRYYLRVDPPSDADPEPPVQHIRETFWQTGSGVTQFNDDWPSSLPVINKDRFYNGLGKYGLIRYEDNDHQTLYHQINGSTVRALDKSRFHSIHSALGQDIVSYNTADGSVYSLDAGASFNDTKVWNGSALVSTGMGKMDDHLTMLIGGENIIINQQQKRMSELVANGEGWSDFDLHDINSHGLIVGTAKYNGVDTNVALLPVDLEEVYETDQVWNKAPNPRRPAYENADSIPDDELYNRLFVAIEPHSSKIEITAQLKDRMEDSIVEKFLAGVRDQATGNLVNEFAAFSNPADASLGSVSELKFTPAGSGEDAVYEVIVGLDSDSDGSLSSSEVLELGGTPFTLSALTASDISDALSSPVFVGGKAVLIVKDMIAYFLGNSSTVGEASLTGSVSHPITDTAITMIAGSDYDQGTGETDVPEFHANSSSDYAGILVSHFSADASIGLYQLVQRTWARHATEIWNHFETTGDTEKLFTYLIDEADSSLNFYYGYGLGLNPPRLAFGNAKASGGTVSLNLYRDGDRIYASLISFNTTVEDTYDFDFTRPESSASRKGAIIQVSYDGGRNQGRIFHVGVDVSASFVDTTEFDTFPDPIEFFNQNSYIENGQVISVPDAGSGSE